MAHGLPDYYRGVDIAYQALAQLLVRPSYGAAQIDKGGKQVTADTDTELASISGKGVIYGGYVRLAHSSSQKSSSAFLVIDGTDMSAVAFVALNDYRINRPGANSIYLLQYDDVGFKYAAGLSQGITFESSVKLMYREEHTSTPVVYHSLEYALTV